MSADEIRARVLEQFCSMLNVTELSDGAYSLWTPFLFSDGDAYPVVLEQLHEGWRFTDRGGSAGHLFFDDLELTEHRLNFIRRVADHDGVDVSEDFALTSEVYDALPTPVDLADFIQALARVSAVVGLERHAVEPYVSTVRNEVESWLLPDTFEPGWCDPVNDTRRLYPADLRIASLPGRSVAAFFVANPERASTSEVNAMRYRTWNLPVDSVVAYRPNSLSSPSVERLQDVIGLNRVVGVSADEQGYRTFRRVLREAGVPVSAQ